MVGFHLMALMEQHCSVTLMWLSYLCMPLECISQGTWAIGWILEFFDRGNVGNWFIHSSFGVGYWANIHSFYYYLIIQMIAGLFQSTGWPSVVAVVGNWFGKKKRGLIMGIWNAHTSVGNIAGSLVASILLKYGSVGRWLYLVSLFLLVVW
uniref:Putative ovule protein n=1 Tax=Solanum chacoense TaxID=4108 RepID=A0A0V0H246_SOLCH